MRSISQYNEISDDAIKLKFLLDGDYEVIKSIESIIFCKMRNETGCLLDMCPHFTSIPTSLINKENRCTFPIHCGEKTEHLLLATYEIIEFEKIKEIVLKLNENIPKYVTRWKGIIQCEFEQLYVDMKNKGVYAVWERRSPLYQPVKFTEDIYNASRELSDKKASFIVAIKRGDI